MFSFRSTFVLGLTLLALGAGGCSASAEDEASGAGGEDIGGAAGFSTEAATAVVSGPVAVNSDAAAWSVTNQWADASTANARKGGIAWGENSGLTWEQKFSKWIESFEQVDNKNGWSKTIRFMTPWGKKMDGPVLECADTATWLRMTFASWYHLPFYLQGQVNGKAIYMGHFGVIGSDGNVFAGFPRFQAQYKDYEPSWKAGDAWPADTKLQSKHIGGDDGAGGVDVGDGKLPEGAGAGAYFDKLFLNKRAGYLMVILDGYFGSANLADGVNMFHVKPEAIAPGDALLERFNTNGIGHTLPIMTVEKPSAEKLRVTVASGSMPRRQAVWEEAGSSAHYFEQDPMGSAAMNYDTPPVPYAKLGGGLRRWRTPVLNGGRWNNIVPVSDRGVYIPDADLAAIGARTERFKVLLAEDTPEAKRDAALTIISAARQNLKNFPASCSTRTKREEGFKMLYEASEAMGIARSKVDADNRTLEDYVFAELDYENSKTCCWNSTTSAMASIVLDYATKEKAAADAAGTCKQPTVFSAHTGGYDLWKNHAESLGKGADWKAWSEDEPCTQRGTVEDKLTETGKTAMCQ
ncbi:MAG: hypothetical protein JWP97_2006 [Labilithrix sp.]|nr:hypothetical protein [Labilithrix sp.]